MNTRQECLHISALLDELDNFVHIVHILTSYFSLTLEAGLPASRGALPGAYSADSAIC